MSAARWRQRIQYQPAVLPILLLLESNGRKTAISSVERYRLGQRDALPEPRTICDNVDIAKQPRVHSPEFFGRIYHDGWDHGPPFITGVLFRLEAFVLRISAFNLMRGMHLP